MCDPSPLLYTFYQANPNPSPEIESWLVLAQWAFHHRIHPKTIEINDRQQTAINHQPRHQQGGGRGRREEACRPLVSYHHKLKHFNTKVIYTPKKLKLKKEESPS